MPRPWPTPSRACPATTASGLNPLTLTRTDRGRRLPLALRRPVQLRAAAPDDRPPGDARRATSGPAATTSSRPSTATRASRSRRTRVDPTPRRHPPARQRGRAPGTTRCRSASSSAWPRASAPACTTPGAATSTPPPRSSTSRTPRWRWRRTPSTSRADKGRSSYDRPHRLTGNFVYELPVLREQKGLPGQALRRLAGQLELHLPERLAVLGPERHRPHGRARRHRRPGGQQHPAECSTPTSTSPT